MATVSAISHPRYSFQVKWKEGGKWVKRYFRTRREADRCRAEVGAELAQAAPADEPISAEERAAVLLARREGVSLDAAVREMMRRRGAETRVPTMGMLVEQRLGEAARAKRSVRYQADLRRFLEDIREVIGAEVLVDGVHSSHLAPLVYVSGAAATVEKRRLMLHGLFESAVTRRQIERNPVSELQRMTTDADGEVGILTLIEAQELWMHCQTVAPALVPAVAVGLWGGLRAAEIMRLDWSAVRLSTGVIHVGATKSKTRQRRLVTIEEPLRQVLAGQHRNSGPIWPANGRKLLDAVRMAAGWQRRQGRPGRPWPHNAMRHSFVTYHLGFFGDAAKTALEAGHSQDVLFRHYRELVTKEDAAAWWGGWTIE